MTTRKSDSPNCNPEANAVWRRWLTFNAVGVIGVGVQLLCLYAMKEWFGVHYLAATALAVEAAILHNFFWHERWTWLDRTSRNRSGLAQRLWRFNLSVGIVSISSNLFFMAVLVGRIGIHYLPANVICISTGSLLNFLAGDRLVFRNPDAAAASRKATMLLNEPAEVPSHDASLSSRVIDPLLRKQNNTRPGDARDVSAGAGHNGPRRS